MNSNSEIIQKDDQFYSVYGNTYADKINYLQTAITKNETGKNEFIVLDFEAGLGKSRYTNIILKKYINQFPIRKFLIVKKFNDDSISTAEYLESGFVKNVALAITADNWGKGKKWKDNLDELSKKQVLIISHKRYMDLCLDDDTRSYFMKGRHTLIIDEKVNFPIYTYNDGLYTKIHKMLPHALRGYLEAVCKSLNVILMNLKDDKKTNKISKVKPKVKQKSLDNFLKLMECNKYAVTDKKDRALLDDFLEGLQLWYSTDFPSVANAGNISTRNPLHKHWGLDNNIILDASATIDGIYKIDEKFTVQRQTHFIDHSNCEFTHFNFNSSKSELEQKKNKYFPEITRRIAKEHTDGEKTLIVVHKGFTEIAFKHLSKEVGIQNVWKDKEDKVNDADYDNQPFAIAWFGNLIGKNTFSDFDNIWILGTPNIPLEQYLVLYQHYGGELGRRGLDIHRGRFRNDQFKDVQEGYIAAELYQTLKRIQRNPNPKGKFYIVNHDEGIVKNVLKGIKNASLTEPAIKLTFDEEEKRKKAEAKVKNRKPTQPELVREYLLQQKPGTVIDKDELKKKFKISNTSKVMGHHLIVELNQSNLNRIKVERNQVIVL